MISTNIQSSEKNLTIPALVFHSIRKVAGKDLHALEPSQLDEILAMIIENFGGTVNLKDLISGQNPLTNKNGVLVTFDDGYEDHFKVALPILQKYKATATFFLLPKYFSQQNFWDHRSQVFLNHLSIEQANGLVAAGQTIGSHGLTHNSLLKFNYGELENEFKESKNMLEDILQTEICCFSYPYGDVDDNIASSAAKVYRYSFATNKETVPNWYKSGCAQIRRERVLSNMSLKEIEKLLFLSSTYVGNYQKKYE